MLLIRYWRVSRPEKALHSCPVRSEEEQFPEFTWPTEVTSLLCRGFAAIRLHRKDFPHKASNKLRLPE